MHALFLPAFEGPDEPHHLARVTAFGGQSLLAALPDRAARPLLAATAVFVLAANAAWFAAAVRVYGSSGV